MVLMMPKRCMYAIVLVALFGSCNGFIRSPPAQRSFPLIASEKCGAVAGFKSQRRENMMLQLSSDGKANQEFWEKQKELAQEMSDSADKSLRQ
jgi:hypothetical protein